MIQDILDLLAQSPVVRDCRIWEQAEAPNGAFVLKVRCRVAAHFAFQVWIKSTTRGTRYAYQLLAGEKTILRWDNSPHFPRLENYPHHRHPSTAKPTASKLRGRVLEDLTQVLKEIEDYLET